MTVSGPIIVAVAGVGQVQLMIVGGNHTLIDRFIRYTIENILGRPAIVGRYENVV